MLSSSEIIVSVLNTPSTSSIENIISLACSVPFALILHKMLGYNFIAYVGVLIDRSRRTYEIIEELKKKPYVTVAHITTGKYNIFCKIRAKGTEHAREIIFSIDDVEGVLRTETMISLEESINDKKRLMKNIFQEL